MTFQFPGGQVSPCPPAGAPVPNSVSRIRVTVKKTSQQEQSFSRCFSHFLCAFVSSLLNKESVVQPYETAFRSYASKRIDFICGLSKFHGKILDEQSGNLLDLLRNLRINSLNL